AGIAESAVAVQRERERGLLVAHYVPAPGAVIDEAYLRAGLADLLPDQMVPAAFAPCAALPTTSSGKTDRNALPHIRVDTREQTAKEPANDLEARLLAVWRAVLGDDGIGPADDFFQSGGTSILVAQLLTEVRDRVHEDARIVDLFRYPSVRAYAARQRRGQQVSRKKQLRADAFRPVTD
ncbi:phosphopantetheine-binding protein, partial [Streptomyces milbemycinicus]|uniref:phosphopantetheine-binding protein n=1 Tax=Streptomyces milbemycinicus TaxID=476552 RepID=UPI001B80D211